MPGETLLLSTTIKVTEPTADFPFLSGRPSSEMSQGRLRFLRMSSVLVKYVCSLLTV